MSTFITAMLSTLRRRPGLAAPPDWNRRIAALNRECDALLQQIRTPH